MLEEDEYQYDVTYIVHQGREALVDEQFIKEIEADDGPRRTKGRCKFCGSFIRDCRHDQDGPDPFLLEEALRKRQLQQQQELAAASAGGSSTGHFDGKDEATGIQGILQKRKRTEGTKKQAKKPAKVRIQYDDTLNEDEELLALDVAQQSKQQPNKALETMDVVIVERAEELKKPAIKPTDKPFPNSSSSSKSAVTVESTSSTSSSSSSSSSSEQSTTIVDSGTARDEAKQLHKSIFNSCLLEHDKEDDFIAKEDNAHVRINAEYQSFVAVIKTLRKDVAWELLNLSFNFILNLVQRAEMLKGRRQQLIQTCKSLDMSLMDENETIEERLELANEIVTLDDQQEALFRQIERAGFDVFVKAEHRFKVCCKQDTSSTTSRQVKMRLEHMSLQKSEIALTWSSELKQARKDMELVSDLFEDAFGYRAEDMVDGILDGEGSEDEDDAEEEEDAFIAAASRGAGSLSTAASSRVAVIRDNAASAISKIRSTSQQEHDDDHSSSKAKKQRTSNLSSTSHPSSPSSNRSSKPILEDAGFFFDAELREAKLQTIKNQRSTASKPKKLTAKEKEMLEFQDFLAPDDDLIVFSQFYERNNHRKKKERAERDVQQRSAAAKDPTGNTHNNQKKHSNDAEYDLTEDDKKASQKKRFDAKFYKKRVLPIDANARFNGRILVLETPEQLLHNSFNLNLETVHYPTNTRSEDARFNNGARKSNKNKN